MFERATCNKDRNIKKISSLLANGTRPKDIVLICRTNNGKVKSFQRLKGCDINPDEIGFIGTMSDYLKKSFEESKKEFSELQARI